MTTNPTDEVTDPGGAYVLRTGPVRPSTARSSAEYSQHDPNLLISQLTESPLPGGQRVTISEEPPSYIDGPTSLPDGADRSLPTYLPNLT